MPRSSKSLTSAIRVTLGFPGVLGVMSVGVACALPKGRVVHSGSSGVGKEMLIHRWGCSPEVTLEPLYSSSGRLMMTSWSLLFRPT